jgi:hypothetical protein
MLTVPKPFRFNGVSKKTKIQPRSPFVPMAIRVKSFEKDTPERFKAKPKVYFGLNEVISRILRNQLTLPQSPKLSTKLRAKQTKY